MKRASFIAIAMGLVSPTLTAVDETFQTLDVAASSTKLLECLNKPEQWKSEITSRRIVDFPTLAKKPGLPQVCIQYISCDERDSRKRFSQILECQTSRPGVCETLTSCLEKRALGQQPFYLAEIEAGTGPTSYATAGPMECKQVGRPEALYGSAEAFLCLQKMDCAGETIPRQRYVFACAVSGKKKMQALPDGSFDNVQECQAFQDCARNQILLPTFTSYADFPVPKAVLAKPQTKALAKRPKRVLSSRPTKKSAPVKARSRKVR